MRPDYSNCAVKGRVQRAPTLGDIIRGYKSTTTRQVNALLQRSSGPVWQRNYYEHIIRNDNAYTRIVEYIQNNPQKWHEDRYHP